MNRVAGPRGRRTRRRWLLAVLLPIVVLLTGCAGGYTPAGPFHEVPDADPPQVAPPAPQAPAPESTDPSDPSDPTEDDDPNVVATDLRVPTGIAVLPDGTAIVGERDTGRLVHVFPDRSPAKVLMTLPVDAGGDGGLLGLAVSPTYAEDDLLYAYVSTATDNRVVRFPIGGTPNPVLTGIPHGSSHNGGGLAFGADGTLYVGTGDTGRTALAADRSSLAGKVLAIDVFGKPVGETPVYSRGHADVTGLCTPDGTQLYAADRTGGKDVLEAVRTGGSGGERVLERPSAESGFGGCAAAATATGGTGLFAGELTGTQVTAGQLDEKGAQTADPQELLTGTYGRLRSVALDSSGGLWITTSNRDGAGKPTEDDDRVLRIVPPSGGSGSPL